MESQIINTPLICKYCGLPITPGDPFCPHCGKKLIDKTISTGFWSLAWLFILSTLLPPLGIGLTIRYIKSNDERAKTAGWISLLITIVAIVVIVMLSISAMDSLSKQVNTQLQNYEF